MTDPVIPSTVSPVVSLLLHYGFEMKEADAQALVDRWLETYPAPWIRLALVEALYQGRYKSVSVEQFLIFWQRRGQPLHHFSHEFERLVCNNLPQKLHNLPSLPERTWPELRSPQILPAASPPRLLPSRGAVAVSLPFVQNSPARETPHQPSLAPEPTGTDVRPQLPQANNELDADPLDADGLNDQELTRLLPTLKASSITFSRPPVAPSHLLIHQFQPETEASSLYTKLTALARGQAATTGTPED